MQNLNINVAEKHNECPPLNRFLLTAGMFSTVCIGDHISHLYVVALNSIMLKRQGQSYGLGALRTDTIEIVPPANSLMITLRLEVLFAMKTTSSSKA